VFFMYEYGRIGKVIWKVRGEVVRKLLNNLS
jgi:hypothetical protein